MFVVETRRRARVPVVAALLLSVALAGCVDREEEVEPEETIGEGKTFEIHESTTSAVERASASFEVEGRADGTSLTVELADPNGNILVARTVNLTSGDSETIELEHEFEDDDGPIGQYVARVRVLSGEAMIGHGRIELDPTRV